VVEGVRQGGDDQGGCRAAAAPGEACDHRVCRSGDAGGDHVDAGRVRDRCLPLPGLQKQRVERRHNTAAAAQTAGPASLGASGYHDHDCDRVCVRICMLRGVMRRGSREGI